MLALAEASQSCRVSVLLFPAEVIRGYCQQPRHQHPGVGGSTARKRVRCQARYAPGTVFAIESRESRRCGSSGPRDPRELFDDTLILPLGQGETMESPDGAGVQRS